MKYLLAFCIANLVLSQSLYSADLADLKTPPRIEPKYSATTPGYLLLVFGSKTSIPVWLVADEECVYIDRNSNGDLTDAGEKIEAAKKELLTNPNSLFRELRTYDLGDIKTSLGEPEYRNILLQQFRGPTEKFVAVTNQEKEQRELLERFPYRVGNIRVDVGNFRQNTGPLLGTSPADATVVHFDGPMSLSIDAPGENQLIEIDPANHEFPFKFRLGTPGLGPSAFVFTEAPLLPVMHAVNKDGNNNEHRGTVDLRYCGADYCTTVKLPMGKIPQVVTLSISVPSFAGREVKPLQLHVKLKQP